MSANEQMAAAEGLDFVPYTRPTGIDTAEPLKIGVLISGSGTNLQALIEDEVLMALPLVPRHEVCPDPVRLGAQTDDFDSAGEAKRQPFAALAALKSEKKSG